MRYDNLSSVQITVRKYKKNYCQRASRAETLPPTKAMTRMREILKPLTQSKLMENNMSFEIEPELRYLNNIFLDEILYILLAFFILYDCYLLSCSSF